MIRRRIDGAITRRGGPTAPAIFMDSDDLIHAMFQGTTVVLSDEMPPNTMVVSTDIYKKMTTWQNRGVHNQAISILALLSFSATCEVPKWFLEVVESQ